MKWRTRVAVNIANHLVWDYLTFLLLTAFVVFLIYKPDLSQKYMVETNGVDPTLIDDDVLVVQPDNEQYNLIMDLYARISWLRWIIILYLCIKLYVDKINWFEQKMYESMSYEGWHDYLTLKFKFILFLNRVKRVVRW